MHHRTLRAPRARALLAITAVAIAVLPVATATADATAGQAAQGTARQLKALKRQVAETAALMKRVSALEAALAAPPAPVPQVPASLPPIGLAGGDLSGSYPNPQLGASSILSGDIADGAINTDDLARGAIGSTQIADESIVSNDIANGSPFGADLASGSVGANQLAAVEVVTGGPNNAPPQGTIGNEVTCPAGTRLIGGGIKWDLTQGGNPADISLLDNLRIVGLGPRPTPPLSGLQPDTWEVGGMNHNTRATFTLFAVALCLRFE
jgi:hypothetical protein